MKLTIHIKIKSLNKLAGYHWSARHSARKIWEKAVWVEIIKAGWRNINVYFKNVEITSFRKRLLDEDNLIGGCKPLVDALKQLQLIKNDDPKSVKITYDQIQSKDEKTELIFY